MKLTKLYIHNYKSFYDTTIELDKMNIVVGENNSGKSNLIDVLEFIDIALTKDVHSAVVDKGGWDKIINYNSQEDKIIIEFELENKKDLQKIQLTVEEKLWYQSTITYSEIAKTYAFNTETIRSKSHEKLDIALQKDGRNLGENLFYIKSNNPEKFEIISNSMIGIVNEIDGVDVKEVFGRYLIGFKEKNRIIGIDDVSDGTINVLATITALNQEDDKSILLAFDEPERYLHLKAVNYLLESFRASEKQILITTHSTEILKYANLDEIVFIYRDSDGDTQSIRANKIDGLKDMLKELSYERDLTLDELIADGVIGDFR